MGNIHCLVVFIIIQLFYIPFETGNKHNSPKNQKPNIVLIMADDMGYETLGVNGSVEYSTPVLDRIAKKGTRFTQCYSQPLCTPSRVKIMTGKHNFRNYEYFGYLNENEKTFGHLMQEAGYKTCIVGKWQLNGIVFKIPGYDDLTRPGKMGFEEFALWQVTDNNGSRYANPYINTNGVAKFYGIDKYGPDIFSDYAVDFIKRNKNNPFFLYYPMVLVHSPFVPTPDSPEWLDKTLRDKNDTSFFADMMNYTDKIVGKIEEALQDNNVYENTLFIFTADNGTHFTIYSNTKDRVVKGAKGNTITDGTHVPLIAHWPKYNENSSVCSNLISFADFMPTFADLLDNSVETDGNSFLPAISSKDPQKEQDKILIYYDPMWNSRVNKYRGYFAQTTGYKLYNSGKFYNIKNDILEENPLIYDNLSGKEKNIYNELKKELKKVTHWNPDGGAKPNPVE
ncbi:sulfatase-like hydrolase/transferase [Maribellus maritimus]|uniref:sulfatase-like hydrolase/transferase n=1 Tax=Maribellus maritimus TaxID=2870838 RepID=UPI001EEC9955|nr:sulfatase-like hydrolase/transferase [Maribellus maritimus]MCG6187364.1 sulfatase-like hydrolase/transferase [Maribellus maritimus]